MAFAFGFAVQLPTYQITHLPNLSSSSASSVPLRFQGVDFDVAVGVAFDFPDY